MSPQTFVRSTANTFMQDINHLRLIRRMRRQRIETIRSALILVNKKHVTFNSLGFDQNFIQNEAASLMVPFLYHGVIPRAEELACLWAEHFQVKGRAKHSLVRRVLPMMNDFVYLLKSEAEQIRVPLAISISQVYPEPTLQA